MSILLVEQNARAALQVSDYGYVLETGELAIEGPSAELAANPRVAATYLGKGTSVAGCPSIPACGLRDPGRRRPAALQVPLAGAARNARQWRFPQRNAVTDLSVPPVSGALLAEARRLLLEPAGLDDAQLSRVLASIHTHDVDFADLYFQYSRMESWSLEEGIVKSGSFNIDRGVGIRAVHGDKQAFAYSDDITLAAMDEAAVAARAIGRQGQSAVAAIGRIGAARSLYAPTDPSRRCPRTRRSRCSSGSSGWRARATRGSRR